jgi:WD40 repeat protein
MDTARRTIVGQFDPPDRLNQGVMPALAFSPDGKRLAVGSYQGRIILWSVAIPARPSPELRLPGRGKVNGLVFDDHGRRLASTGGDPTVEIWDLDLIERELGRLGLGKP